MSCPSHPAVHRHLPPCVLTQQVRQKDVPRPTSGTTPSPREHLPSSIPRPHHTSRSRDTLGRLHAQALHRCGLVYMRDGRKRGGEAAARTVGQIALMYQSINTRPWQVRACRCLQTDDMRQRESAREEMRRETKPSAHGVEMRGGQSPGPAGNEGVDGGGRGPSVREALGVLYALTVLETVRMDHAK
jgi:hypothetical protein